jgi:hypothetical protein
MINNSPLTYNITLKIDKKKPNSIIERVTQEDAKQILKALNNPSILLNAYQNDIRNKILAYNNHRGLFRHTYTSRVQAIIKKLEEIANENDHQKIGNQTIKCGRGIFFFNSSKYYVNCKLEYNLPSDQKKYCINDIKSGKLSQNDNYQIFQDLFNHESIVEYQSIQNVETIKNLVIKLLADGKMSDKNIEQIFEDVLIKPKGIFKNANHPDIEKIIKALIKLLADGKNLARKDALMQSLYKGNISHKNIYQIFKDVLIEPKGIFEDANHLDTISIKVDLIKLLADGKLGEEYSYQIFRDVWIEPKGIFEYVKHSDTISIKGDLIKLLADGKLGKKYSYQIFRDVLIEPKGIFEDINHLDTIRIRSDLITLLADGKLGEEYSYQIFRDVWIEPKGIFKEAMNLYTIKIKKILMELIGNDKLVGKYRHQIFIDLFLGFEGIFKEAKHPDTIEIKNILMLKNMKVDILLELKSKKNNKINNL